MEMNKQMQEVLDKYAALNPLAIENLTPQAARQLPELRDAVLAVMQEHTAKRFLGGVIESVGQIEHILIPGPAGQMLARIYKPNTEGPHPILLYLHGGGWVLANLNSYDSSCRALTNSANCIVVSLAYRQAPEHKYPAAHEDALAAYQWLLEHAVDIGGKHGIVAVAGESAGGNLAASVCLMARDLGSIAPVHQLLIYPVLDSRMDTYSYRHNEHARPLNRAMMPWFFKHYFRGVKADPRAFPLQSKSFADLPPATILTAELDPLCTEGEAYARKLEEAGIHVFYKRYNGLGHEFFGLANVVDDAKTAVHEAASQLRAAFDSYNPDERISKSTLTRARAYLPLEARQ